MRISISLLLAVALTLFCSCSDQREQSHPVFIKADRAERQGKYDIAAQYYEEYLLTNPKSALTHKRLASIYDDNISNPMMAMEHYRKYLQYLPPDNPDRDNYRQFLDSAERKYYLKLKQQYEDLDKIEELQIKLSDVEKQKERYKAGVMKLYKLNRALRLKLKQQESTNTKGKAGKSTRSSSTRGSAKPGDGTKYHVVSGDTLVSISRKVYGTTKYYATIYDANRDSLRSESDLQIGQTLIIPPKPED